MSKNTLKLSTTGWKKLKYDSRKWLKIRINCPQLVGEHFEILWPQMATNTLKLSTIGWRKLKYDSRKWLKIHLNYPPLVGIF